MSKKLKLNPSTSYLLGLYERNKGKAIGVATSINGVVSRFVKASIDEFGIEPNKILVEGEDDLVKAYFYNSKLKKLMDKALETRTRIFKYKNDYSGSYFAAIFDMDGGKDPKGMFIRELDEEDDFVLQKLGFHTIRRGSKLYILNEGEFVKLIGKFSEKLS